MNRDEFHDRLADLEGRYAFLDDLVHHLSDVIAGQQQRLDALEEDLRRTRETLKAAVPDAAADGPEPPPPHY
jgi:uncharacterized coiled-coil protein SlyX